MAEVIWTEPALQELSAIAEYIALDNPTAASRLVEEVFDKTDRLEGFPQSGRIPPELPNSVYREVGCFVHTCLGAANQARHSNALASASLRQGHRCAQRYAPKENHDQWRD